MAMWQVDCHVHTEYSSDGVVPVDKIVDICRHKGLQCIAVTDHNTIEGALRVKEAAKDDLHVIVGEEVKTSEGEVIGLFLHKHIPPGLTVGETVNEIKRQNGLVYIPHPFCRFRKSRIDFAALQRIIDHVDIIEVFNSRNIVKEDNERAYRFAAISKKAVAVGSDAHLGYEYGRSYLRIRPFSNADEFLVNLKSAGTVTRRSPLWVHIVTKAGGVIHGLQKN